MKIVIGTDGKELNSSVAKRFGHAAFYLLYNTKDKTFEAVENIDEDHSHSVLHTLVERGTDIFIVGNIGPHAFGILKSGSGKVFLARKMNAIEAIESFNKNELKELDEPTAKRSIGHRDDGEHNHGGNHNSGQGHHRRHHK